MLGEFNIAGETWMIRIYYERMGIEVVATITGDGRVDELRRCHGAKLNLVQCSGSMTTSGRDDGGRLRHPVPTVSFFGIEDTAKALYDVAGVFGRPAIMERARGIW
jgi:nitrogenase molybdenum-cofactor synthesis protein NifE